MAKGATFSFPAGAEGAFGDLGGVVDVTVEWIPDPDVIAAHLVQAAGHFENLEAPLLASKAIARADMQMHFDTESSPDGAAWTPLDPEYLASKTAMGGDTRILRFWGELEKAATDGAAYVVNGHTLFYNTSFLPFYWVWIQAGTGTGGDVGKRHAFFQSITEKGKEISGGTHQNTGVGRGNAMPARPFLGLSAEAELQIFEVFDLWFAEGFSIAISGSGTVQERVGGKFGRKIYPR